MKTTKQKIELEIELEDYEIEQIIHCVKYTREETLGFHSGQEYSDVDNLFDDIIFKLKNMLIITNKNK